jgi:hypothetical protein
VDAGAPGPVTPDAADGLRALRDLLTQDLTPKAKPVPRDLADYWRTIPDPPS